MRTSLTAVVLAALAAVPAAAQTFGVQVRNGDVYVQFPSGPLRITRDGKVGEATLSRDGKLIAYVHDGPDGADDLYVCSVAQRTCVLAVAHSQTGDDVTKNLMGISGAHFSFQAGEKTDGALVGSVYFLSEAGGATTMSVHRLLLGGKTVRQLPGSPAPFVTYSRTLAIVPSGRFTGALDLDIVHDTAHGACGAATIYDPNTNKVLQEGPATDC